MANSSVTVYAGPGDGYVRKYGGAWSGISATGAVTGNDAGPTSTADYLCMSENTNPMAYRGFLPFNLGGAGIPAGAVVVGLTLYVYVTAKGSAGGGSAENNSVTVVRGTPASNTTLATTDYGNVGGTEWVDSRTGFSSFATSAYNSFALNAAAVAQANSDIAGYFVPALRAGYDFDNVAPSGNSNIQTRYSEYSGTSNDPYLVVEYSASRTAADVIAWSDSADLGDGIEGGFPVSHRTATDTLAWSDAATLLAAPAARTVVGSPVKVFASNGVPSTFGAHYAFGSTIALPDSRLLCAAVKGSYHGDPSGVTVGKLSSDDGATWGSEFSMPNATRIRAAGSRILACVNNGFGSAQPTFVYSDDYAATWSTPVTITHGFMADHMMPDDIIRLANGDLLVVGYGFDDAAAEAATEYTLRVSRSQDDGATWSALAEVTGLVGGYAAVEAQFEQIASTGDLFMTFHTQDSLPTDFYRIRSQDNGATWGTPIKVNDGDSFNRQGLTSFANDGVLVSYNRWNSGAPSVSYVESYDGTTFGAPVEVAGYPVGGGSYAHPLWAMCTALGGEGLSQNVGFTYSTESGAQTSAETYYVQFSGIDGTIVYRRAGSDSLTFTDSPSWVPSFNRTGADSLAFTDTAVRDTLTFARTGADSLSLTDSATGERLAHESSGADTLTWTDTGTRITSTGRTGTDGLAWTDTGTRTTYRLATTADTLAFTDTASGSVGAGQPVPPYTLIGTSRRRHTADGSSRAHADLTGGPTP